MGATGLEPVTPSLSSKGASVASIDNKEVAPTQQSGCTTGCTIDGKSEQTDPVAALAAALGGLSPADRARLAALLTGQQTGQGQGE